MSSILTTIIIISTFILHPFLYPHVLPPEKKLEISYILFEQGRYITKDGKRMLVLPQQVMQQYQQSLKQQQQSQQQQSAVGGGLGGTGTSTTALPSTTTQSPSTESLNLLSPGTYGLIFNSATTL